MDVTLSIIVPAYNAVNYLEACIDSIMASTYQDFEILLVDDGSTDGTSVLCDQLAERYNKIKVFHTENRGLSMARNLGIEQAKGKYIGFVDSDDLIASDMYGTMVEQMDNDIQLVCCRFHRCKREEIEPLSNSGVHRTHWREEIAEQILCNYYGAYVWSKLFRSDLLESNQIRFKPGVILEDQYFMADYLRVCHKAVFLEDKLYYYIDTPGSITYRFRTSTKVADKYMSIPRAHNYMAETLSELGYGLSEWSKASAAMFYQTVLRKLESPAEDYINESVSYVRRNRKYLRKRNFAVKYYISAWILSLSWPLWRKIFRRGADQ